MPTLQDHAQHLLYPALVRLGGLGLEGGFWGLAVPKVIHKRHKTIGSKNLKTVSLGAATGPSSFLTGLVAEN